MSTWDLRGDRNMTASRAGTSTPSDKQRALDRIRQDTDVSSDPPACGPDDACRVGAGAPRSPESQDSRPLRSMMFMEPSTWRTSTEPSRF